MSGKRKIERGNGNGAVNEDVGKPKFKYLIPNSTWCIIITSSGKHFYHDFATGRSCWQLLEIPEEDVINEFNKLDRMDLIILTAKARGLNLDGYEKEEVKEEINEVNEEINEEVNEEINEVEGKSEEIKDEIIVQQSTIVRNPLVSGYGSSSEEESEDEIELEQKIPDEIESSEQNVPEDVSSDEDQGGLDLNLSDTDSDNEEGIDLEALSDLEAEEDTASKDNEAEFWQLIGESEVDPYNIWDFEVEKMITDSRFYLVENDSRRKELFDQWCKARIQQLKEWEELNSQEEIPAENVGDDVEEEEDHMANNPQIQFLRYLEDSETKGLFYIDFKRKHRGEDSFKLNELSDKAKEKLYREYTGYAKKSHQERKSILERYLAESRAFKQAITTAALDPATINQFSQLLNSGDERLLQTLIHKCSVPESVIEGGKFYSMEAQGRLQVMINIIEMLSHHQ